MTKHRSHDTPGDWPEDEEFDFESPSHEPWGSAQGEVEEAELAAQLLEITNEFELDQFIGGLVQNAAHAAGAPLPPPVLAPLASTLKGTLKHAIPVVGGASAMPFDAVGDTRRLAAAAAAFGLELEALSPEDQEFELARRFVRLARGAGRRASRFTRRMPARATVRRALAGAARRYAPGLLRRRRRGRRIMVPVPVPYPVPVAEPLPPVEPDPDQPADQDSDADPAAEPNGFSDTPADAATETAPRAGATCTCGTCAHCQPRSSGRWVRASGRIILQDV